MMPVMNIGIDCRFAATQSGLGRYTREIVTALLALNSNKNGILYTIFVRKKGEEWIASLPPGVIVLQAPFRPYSLSEQVFFPRLIKKSGIDLLFSPHFNVPFFCPTPFVVTIHDLILHRFPGEASLLRRVGYHVIMRHSVRAARAIIAVSQFTANEICTAYGEVQRTKISVIPEGVSTLLTPRSHEEIESVKKKYGLTLPYFLYVGTAKAHKQVPLLLQAFASVADDHMLVLVTDGKETECLRSEKYVLRILSVPDVELAALYSGAKAFVTASIYEGFGLPLAEAHACGCPVIAFRVSAIPEVAPPHSALVSSDVAALSQAMQNPPLRPTPLHRSWKDVSVQTLAVLAKSVHV